MPTRTIRAEYIWIDGTPFTAQTRSKTKILSGPVKTLNDIPEWGFDGSSTCQAEGRTSDLLLRPARFIRDPFHSEHDVLVLCEVLNPDGTPHRSNTRARCKKIAQQYAHAECWFGIEQEYALFAADRPLGWPKDGEPKPQGPYYCSVGAEKAFGRNVMDAHLSACLRAGINVAGTNAEVLLGQWEFQLGPMNALDESDQLWLARWLLHRVGEDFNIAVSLDPKPVREGDWNGSGAHTNFSTKAMREPGGMDRIREACEKLGKRHQEHIRVYGADNALRLTGKYETCSINEFRSGAFDRGASIRIPMATVNSGYGYLEDRRPAANMDPYLVTAIMMETVCGDGKNLGAADHHTDTKTAERAPVAA